MTETRPGPMEMVVPGEFVGPATAPRGSPSRASGQPAAARRDPAGPVNVNQASAEQLQQIPGIGPAMARRILQGRQKGGPYQSPEDLAERVAGIGPKTVERLQENGLLIAPASR